MIKKCKCGNEFTAYNTIQNKCFSCQALHGYGLKKNKQLAVLPKVIINKPKKVKKPRIKSENKKWKDKAWKQFSKYIRYRDCLSTTRTLFKGICYTCGKEFDFKELQAGHCISGRGNFILLDEECVKSQCTQCNIQRNGNYDVFIPKIIRENSLEWFEEKKRLSKLPVKKDWKMEFEKYKAKTDELICSKDTPF